MKILRVLKTLDDLAEVLLFDVMLATPRRRRIAAVLAGTAALSLYLGCGFLTAPACVQPPHLGVPFVPGSGLTEEHDKLVTLAINTGDAASDRLMKLFRPIFARDSHELDRICVTRAPEILMYWCGQVGPRRAADIGTILLARGLYLRRVGEHMAAQANWLAAVRLGIVLTYPRGQREDAASHLLGASLQTRAVRALRDDVAAGRFTRVMARDAAWDLQGRRPLILGVPELVTRYYERAVAILHTWVRTGALPPGYDDLRWYLPVRETARRAMGERILAQMHARYDELVVSWARDGRATLAGRHVEAADRLRALVRDDAAVRVAAALFFDKAVPTMSRYGEMCTKRDAEIAAFERHCRSGEMIR